MFHDRYPVLQRTKTTQPGHFDGSRPSVSPNVERVEALAKAYDRTSAAAEAIHGQMSYSATYDRAYAAGLRTALQMLGL